METVRKRALRSYLKCWNTILLYSNLPCHRSPISEDLRV